MAEGQGPEDLANKLLKFLNLGGCMLFWDKFLGQISITEGVGMADNLILKGSTWHVRLELPEDVRPSFGNRRKLTKSLKTGNKNEAQIRKLQYISVWKEQIEFARNGRPPSDFEFHKYMHHEMGKEISGFDEKLIMDAVNGIANFNEEAFYNDYMHCIKMIDRMYENKKDEKESLLAKLEEYKAEHQEKISEINMEFIIGFIKFRGKIFTDFDNFCNITYSKFNQKQSEELLSIMKEPDKYTPKTIFTDKRLELFEKHQLEIKGLTLKTVDGFKSKLKTLRKYLEENELDISFENFHSFLESIDKSVKTKKNYINAASNFHKWASKYDADYKSRYNTKENPFLGHELPKERKKGQKVVENRKAYTLNEIRPIYDWLIQKGKNQVASTMKIAFYTGCRIEEICKLKPEHIILEDGVSSIYVEQGKSDASIRKVPIHPALLPLIKQLIKDVDIQGYLIHSSGGNKYSIRSDNISKEFGRAKTALGYGITHNFHSVRRTVITTLHHNNVPPLTLSSIVGHETGTITFDVYSEGASAKQKYDAIKTIPNIL